MRTEYLLDAQEWRRYDPELFDVLAGAIAVSRTLNHVSEKQILQSSIFFDREVPDNRAMRTTYFDELRKNVVEAELVFFDPDNGMEVLSCPAGRRNSSKYLMWDELAAMFRSGKSVLVYQHYPREEREAFIGRIARQLRESTSAPRIVSFGTSNVEFFLVIQAHHQERLTRAVEQVRLKWSGQIEVTRH
jgi:hypothetical protein